MFPLDESKNRKPSPNLVFKGDAGEKNINRLPQPKSFRLLGPVIVTREDGSQWLYLTNQ